MEINKMPDYYPFTNTPLPYSYDALVPYIDAQTMYLHHDKHLQTYIDNLNKALNNNPKLQNLSLEQLVRYGDRLPKEVARNAGGVYNHRFYFNGLAPKNINQPNDCFTSELIQAFGSLDDFKQQFKKAALDVFGSGYAWLVTDNNGQLAIVTTANQETPLPNGHCPLINIDVWEHAYYLKHFNKRVNYVDDWFQVADWCAAAERYGSCLLR